MGGAETHRRDVGPRSPDDKLARVSHETIYKCLYVQTRGSLRADLHTCLSTKRGARKRRGSDNRRGVFSSVRNSPSPSGRRSRGSCVPGHWEGDLILGSTASGSAIGTLVERSTRFTICCTCPVITPRHRRRGHDRGDARASDTCGAPSPGTAAARWRTGNRSTRPQHSGVFL